MRSRTGVGEEGRDKKYSSQCSVYEVLLPTFLGPSAIFLVLGSFHCSPPRNGQGPYIGQTTPLRPLGPLSTESPTAARRAENRFSSSNTQLYPYHPNFWLNILLSETRLTSVDILIKRPGPREHVNQLTHTLTSTELPRDQECLPQWRTRYVTHEPLNEGGHQHHTLTALHRDHPGQP